MTLVHSGNNLNEITRSFVGSSDTITGVVNADGRLNFAARTWTVTDFYYHDVILEIVQVSPWDLNLDGAGGMTGRWSEDLTSSWA